MIIDKGIYIKNIFYMLTYAFQTLNQTNYESVASEEFEEIEDLFAAILHKGISKQLKQGLYREYVPIKEDLSLVRGKIEFIGTSKNMIQRKKVLSCEYDELTENNIYNRILKTTAIILIQSSKVKGQQKSDLKKVMLYFGNVDIIDHSAIQWNTLTFQRNNSTYEMLMNICYFILKGMLQTTEKGTYKMAMFSDEHMAKLYEKFILAYYEKHHPYLETNAAQVKWNLDPGNDETAIKFLPTMQTDITLKQNDKILIIDAKYYSHTIQSNFDKNTIHSGNLYQIFTYVKNTDKYGTGKVAGLLLYAKTNEPLSPDWTYSIGGNQISVRTLDLNTSFNLIKKTLDNIVIEYFDKG